MRKEGEGLPGAGGAGLGTPPELSITAPLQAWRCKAGVAMATGWGVSASRSRKPAKENERGGGVRGRGGGVRGRGRRGAGRGKRRAGREAMCGGGESIRGSGAHKSCRGRSCPVRGPRGASDGSWGFPRTHQAPAPCIGSPSNTSSCPYTRPAPSLPPNRLFHLSAPCPALVPGSLTG